MSQPPLLLTVGEIARRLDTKVHRIEYIIRSRNIEATGWAGHARVFSESSLQQIAGELNRMDADRHRDSELTNKEASTHGSV